MLAVTPHPVYSVVWSNGATGAERLVSEAGVYTAEVLLPGSEVLELEPLTLLDGEGDWTLEVPVPWDCVELQNIDVPERLPLHEEILATAPLCFGDANGRLANTPSGNDSFELAVTPGTENLPSGPVYISLTDANGCALDSTFTLSEPPELLGSLITERIKDSGMGFLELAVEGGSRP